ncbi:MAG: hypothetical protein M1840_001830 [Geoglossum simile]|nr:MAG: hypothetical protein M1840_001830 [Geoglossum simile]
MNDGRPQGTIGRAILGGLHPAVRDARIMAGDYWQLRQSVIGGRGPVIVCDEEIAIGRPSELWVSDESRLLENSLVSREIPVIVIEVMKFRWVSRHDIEPLNIDSVPMPSRAPSLLKAFELAAEKHDLSFFKEKLATTKGLKSLLDRISPSTKEERGEEEDARRAIEEALDEIIRRTSEEDSDSKPERADVVLEPPESLPKAMGKQARKRRGEGIFSEEKPAKSAKIEDLAAARPMKVTHDPEMDHFVTIFVGNQQDEFIIERQILKKSPVLESSVIDRDELGPHVLRIFLLRSNVSDFEAVKEFLHESEYTPKLFCRGTDAAHLGDAMTDQQRADEASRCARVYCLALKLVLPELQQLAIEKLETVWFYSGYGILQLAKHVYSNTTDSADQLRRFLVQHIAENMAFLPVMELERTISGCTQLSRDLVMYMARLVHRDW